MILDNLLSLTASLNCSYIIRMAKFSGFFGGGFTWKLFFLELQEKHNSEIKIYIIRDCNVNTGYKY